MTPQQAFIPDYSDMVSASQELCRLMGELSGMTQRVANAKTALEFDSERKKACLSRAVLAAFKAGADSSAKAEHMARASESYSLDMKALAQSYTVAERVKTEFEVLRIKVDALRSLISAQKVAAGIL